MLAAVPIALLGSQALAEDWVKLNDNPDFLGWTVDKDSIRRGSDNLVYYSAKDPSATKEDDAIDCRRRLYYSITLYIDGPINSPDWRNHSLPIAPTSVVEAERQYVCANAG